MQRVEGLPNGQAGVQQHHLARLGDELVAAVPAQEVPHPIPRVCRLIRLRGMRPGMPAFSCAHARSPALDCFFDRDVFFLEI